MTEEKEKCSVCEPSWCRPHYLYVIAGHPVAGLVKVGITYAMGRRASDHRKKQKRRDLVVHFKREFSCEFIAAMKERQALDKLRPYAVKGDWFDCDVSAAIEAVTRA